jgi:hypothetical protein
MASIIIIIITAIITIFIRDSKSRPLRSSARASSS